ncbi:DEAD/DEAH box helicase [Variovorax paradoxus]|nr:DEAD/DEAH box helicase [Variovorax paradoxus]
MTAVANPFEALTRLLEAAIHGQEIPGPSPPALKENTMTPYEAVRERFNFPFELRPYQIEEVNRLSEGNIGIFHYTGSAGDQGDGLNTGHYDEPGTGKTAISTHQMLYQFEYHGVVHYIVLMPPILIPQWARWLRSITYKATAKRLTVTEWVGTPAQRKKLDTTSQFFLMSYQMFKNDWERLWEICEGKLVGVNGDEGHAVKNVESANHKAFHQFVGTERPRMVLTGTPLTKPGDAFGLCRLVAPGRYKNQRHFDRIHVAERDDYDKVTEWANLDVLAESMRINSSRILRREVQSQLPPVQFTPRVYDLDPAHRRLYERLSVEKLLEYDDGREINALNESALYAQLQQMVINWAYFEDDPGKRPAILDVIDQVMDEIGEGKKLAIAAHFVRSNQTLLGALQQYGAVAVYGEVSAKQKQAAISRFIDDPACRIIQLQPSSAGFGVDGLQHVCSDMLIVEAPTTAPPFWQVVARLDRDGQKEPVNCRIAIANKTVQVRMFKNLLANDSQINSVQRGFQDLKDAVLGDEEDDAPLQIQYARPETAEAA